MFLGSIDPVDWLKPLDAALRSAACPANVSAMKMYMRGQFEFLGIKRPQQDEIFRAHWRRMGPPSEAWREDLVRQMWAMPYREYQHLAQGVLDRTRRAYKRADIQLVEELATTKSWWDTVDFLASHTAADIFRRYPDLVIPTVDRWRHSHNFWLVRVCILFQLRYKQHTDWSLLKSLAMQHGTSSEFFIQKALGWALREYSKTNGAAVEGFIESTELRPLTKREGLKWLGRTRRQSS